MTAVNKLPVTRFPRSLVNHLHCFGRNKLRSELICERYTRHVYRGRYNIAGNKCSINAVKQRYSAGAGPECADRSRRDSWSRLGNRVMESTGDKE
jgi:hypothetical protein